MTPLEFIITPSSTCLRSCESCHIGSAALFSKYRWRLHLSHSISTPCRSINRVNSCWHAIATQQYSSSRNSSWYPATSAMHFRISICLVPKPMFEPQFFHFPLESHPQDIRHQSLVQHCIQIILAMITDEADCSYVFCRESSEAWPGRAAQQSWLQFKRDAWLQSNYHFNVRKFCTNWPTNVACAPIQSAVREEQVSALC